MGSLFDKRLIFVIGKGGVGKSTISAAIALAAAARGQRVIVCEVARQERMSAFFHRHGVGFEEAEVNPGLFAISIDPQRSMEEYMRIQLKVGALSGVVARNSLFNYFAAATPGLKEMVTIGKIWELSQLDRLVKGGSKYDVVIVDGPATGHGLAVMRTPKTFAEIARVGPISRQAMTIHRFVSDPDLTGVVAVTTPEEMPVNETLELQRDLFASMDLGFNSVICNGIYPQRFSAAEVAVLDGRLNPGNGDRGPEDMLLRASLKAAMSEYRRARNHRRELRRLSRNVGMPVVRLPFLFKPELSVDEIEQLSKPILAAERTR